MFVYNFDSGVFELFAEKMFCGKFFADREKFSAMR